MWPTPSPGRGSRLGDRDGPQSPRGRLALERSFDTFLGTIGGPGASHLALALDAPPPPWGYQLVRPATLIITGANLVVGFICSAMVFGATWADNPPLFRLYLGLGIVVPFVATSVVTQLNLTIEGRWRPTLARVNAFAYTPIYFLIGSVSIGEAIRRSDPLQLVWLVFAITTLLVSLGAAKVVRTLRSVPVAPVHRGAGRTSLPLVTASVAVAGLLFSLVYAASYIAEDNRARDTPEPEAFEPPSTAGITAPLVDDDEGAGEVCHFSGDGTYELLRVRAGAVAEHVAHGDGRPGRYQGMIFDPACVVTWDPVPGEYQRSPPTNDWHRVTITRLDARTLAWANRAGVTWTLTASGEPVRFETGAEYPYADTPYRSASVVFNDGDPYSGSVAQITGPGGEPYHRLPPGR